LLQNRLLFLHELPALMSAAEVPYPTTSLQNLRRQMKTRTALLKLGSDSAGCAALRRVCPFLVTGRRFPALDAALATMVTHRDSMAMTASAGYTVLLGELLRCPQVPEPEFYLRTFLRAIEGMEKGEPYSCNAPAFHGWSGHLVDFLPTAISRAREYSWTLAEAKEAWGNGPYLLEVVPTVLYALELHAQDPWTAIDEVSRESMEADTLAMLVGACVGALHGPHRGWFLADDLETLIDKCRTLEIFC
jgi:ADP-ribosylglycohydrolase